MTLLRAQFVVAGSDVKLGSLARGPFNGGRAAGAGGRGLYGGG